ncbi:lysine biosynthesis protein LysW [Micromonospora inaquosa]|jgi:alpha-aminoadipate carrier protein LysW|uniref:Lysine biosynthesis protein LysW n=1 Tax=Micromonospora inaquosa TaxID=2203716 RepID=A0A3N9WEU2_9ACTN|nr:lysine biosynthesis protein LysW [Micromonospora inaquosa]RQW99405.1 lysine biosynthesis protein LysW [Micromonospora inaquosa]
MSNLTIASVCLECDTEVAVPTGAELGDILACRGCGQEHEVVEISPTVRLDRAPEIEEDWGE